MRGDCVSRLKVGVPGVKGRPQICSVPGSGFKFDKGCMRDRVTRPQPIFARKNDIIMKNLKFASITVLPALALGFAAFVTGSPMRGVSDHDQGLESRIRQGFAHAPLPLNLKGKAAGSWPGKLPGQCDRRL